MTSDGKPVANILYENIVKERYIISKQLNTSYTDTASITPTERKMLIKYIIEDAKRRKEDMEAAKQSRSKGR